MGVSNHPLSRNRYIKKPQAKVEKNMSTKLQQHRLSDKLCSGQRKLTDANPLSTVAILELQPRDSSCHVVLLIAIRRKPCDWGPSQINGLTLCDHYHRATNLWIYDIIQTCESQQAACFFSVWLAKRRQQIGLAISVR